MAWTIPLVARELRRWRDHAARIPDPGLRVDALSTLQNEYMNAEGAALFAVIPARRHAGLVRFLVAYQVALDYLDTVTEHPAPDMRRHGFRLHHALIDALDGEARVPDYYRERPWEDDGGYLRALVDTCRRETAALPGFERVRPAVLAAASRLSVQVLNHLTAPDERLRALRAWAKTRGGSVLPWFEATAAASSTLGIYALLGSAADPALEEEAVRAIEDAYLWACLACTLLDSLVDHAEDRLSGHHSYASYYEDLEVATTRTCEVVARAIESLNAVPNGARHIVIVTGMISMYLSKGAVDADSATSARLSAVRRQAGWLTAVEVPVTHLMRRLL